MKQSEYNHAYSVHFSPGIWGLFSERKGTTWLCPMRDLVFVCKSQRHQATESKDYSVCKRLEKNVKDEYITHLPDCTCYSCLALFHIVLSYLPPASRSQLNLSNSYFTNKTSRFRSNFVKALCPFPFSKTVSESKQYIGHFLVRYKHVYVLCFFRSI